MKLENQKFVKIIKSLIELKTGTTKIPIKAENWEELIWATLVFMFGKDKVDWDPQSHEKSVDIKAKINGNTVKISAKAGEIKSNGILTVSSYRLTTFNKLEQKLKFIKEQHKNFDFYLICARKIDKENITYYVIKADANKFAPTWMINKNNWQKVSSGYELKSGFNFKAKIVFKMSNQLWYSIPIEYFSSQEIIAEISMPINYLGQGLIEFLKRKFKK